MGTQVATTDGARGTMSINIAAVNYGRATSNVDKYISSIGVGSGGNREKNFPGEQIVFKKGTYFAGIKDTKRPIKGMTKMVFNAPNMMALWAEWKESDSGKRYPSYTAPRFPAMGDEPIDRSTLGKTAEEFDLVDWKKGDAISQEAENAGWEIDTYGTLQDPIKAVLVMPVRFLDSTTVDHLLLSTVTSCIAGYNLYKEIMEGMKLHEGQLPVVTLGVEKKTFKKVVTDKRGRDKKEENTVDVPEFKIVAWVDAIAEDNPAKGGVKVTADEAADLGKVEAKSRSGSKKNGNGTKLLAAPVKGKAKAAPKSRRQVEAEDDDEANL